MTTKGKRIYLDNYNEGARYYHTNMGYKLRNRIATPAQLADSIGSYGTIKRRGFIAGFNSVCRNDGERI